MKRWFNRRWPYYRRCAWPWCFRGMTHDGTCPKHWLPGQDRWSA